MCALWADTAPEGASYEGEFFRFKGLMSYPKPVRPGGVPIHIGGHSKAAARRAGRHGDGLQPLGVAGAELAALVSLMREEAEKNDRDPSALELTLGHALAKITPEKSEKLAALGFGNLPVCVAKTQYGFSDNPALVGAPKDFTVTVKNIKVSAGAGFIVALTGDIMTMPGLPKVPAAENIDVDENGRITGLF